MTIGHLYKNNLSTLSDNNYMYVSEYFYRLIQMGLAINDRTNKLLCPMMHLVYQSCRYLYMIADNQEISFLEVDYR